MRDSFYSWSLRFDRIADSHLQTSHIPQTESHTFYILPVSPRTRTRTQLPKHPLRKETKWWWWCGERPDSATFNYGSRTRYSTRGFLLRLPIPCVSLVARQSFACEMDGAIRMCLRKHILWWVTSGDSIHSWLRNELQRVLRGAWSHIIVGHSIFTL